MSQTTSTEWDAARHHRSSSACFIVHFEGSGTDLYLSTRPLNLPDSAIPTIEEGIRSVSPISHGVDVFSFRYRQNSARIVLSSGWARRAADGSQYTYTDDLGYMLGRSVTIYLYPGAQVQDIADCLVVFKGHATNVRSSADGVEVECDASAIISHRDLPQTVATRADYPNIPPEHDGVTIGMWYGNPYETSPGGQKTSTQQSGAAVPLLISREATDRTTGDGILTYKVDTTALGGLGLDNFYIFIASLNAWSWCRNDGTAFNQTDIQTDGTFKLNTGLSRWQALLYPARALGSSTATDNPLQATDRIEGSACNVIASTSSYADVVFEWTNQGVAENLAINNSLAEMEASPPYVLVYLSLIRARVDGDLDGTAIDLWDGSAWITMDGSDFTWTNGIKKDYDISNGGTFAWNGNHGIYWHLGSGPNGGDGLPLAMRLRFTNSSATWTPGTTEVATIEDLLIKINHHWPRNFQPGQQRLSVLRGGPMAVMLRALNYRPSIKDHKELSSGDVSATGVDDNVDRLFCESTGRSYGSWIESRFAGYEDVQIYEPAHVIESMMREELSLAAASIDTDSFDKFFDATVGIYQSAFPVSGPMGILGLPPNSRIYSADLINRYCWEWGMFLIQTRDGKVKLIDCELGLDTIAEAILPHDLVNGIPILESTTLSGVVNSLTVRYGKTEWDDAFIFTESVTDSSSVTNVTGGVARPDNIDCLYLRNHAGDNNDWNEFGDGRRHIDRLIDRLVGDASQNPAANPQRILSRPHGYVILPTIGHKFAHAEPGDWITLDADAFDPVQKFFGQSWTDINLMVVETEVTESTTILKTFNWQPLPLT